MVRYLYIIGKGEFEITIKTLVDKQIDTGTQKLIPFLRPSDNNAPINSGPVKQ